VCIYVAGVVVADVIHLEADDRRVVDVECGFIDAVGIGGTALGVEGRKRKADAGSGDDQQGRGKITVVYG